MKKTNKQVPGGAALTTTKITDPVFQQYGEPFLVA